MARSIGQIRQTLWELAQRTKTPEIRELAELLREVCEHVEAAAKAAEDAAR